MRLIAPLSLALCALVTCALIATGCASRQVQYTLTKKNVSQEQLSQDLKLLRSASGVKQVTARHDSASTVTIELYLESDSTTKGMQTAGDLGYQAVRN